MASMIDHAGDAGLPDTGMEFVTLHCLGANSLARLALTSVDMCATVARAANDPSAWARWGVALDVLKSLPELKAELHELARSIGDYSYKTDDPQRTPGLWRTIAWDDERLTPIKAKIEGLKERVKSAIEDLHRVEGIPPDTAAKLLSTNYDSAPGPNATGQRLFRMLADLGEIEGALIPLFQSQVQQLLAAIAVRAQPETMLAWLPGFVAVHPPQMLVSVKPPWRAGPFGMMPGQSDYNLLAAGVLNSLTLDDWSPAQVLRLFDATRASIGSRPCGRHQWLPAGESLDQGANLRHRELTSFLEKAHAHTCQPPCTPAPCPIPAVRPAPALKPQFPIEMDTPTLKALMADKQIHGHDAAAMLLLAFEKSVWPAYAEEHEEELEYNDLDFHIITQGERLAAYVHKLRVTRASVIARCLDWVSSYEEAQARESWNPEYGPDCSTSYNGAKAFLNKWSKLAHFPKGSKAAGGVHWSADTCQELTRLIVADGDRRMALTPVVNKYTMQLINRANKAAPSPDLALALDMLKHTTE